MKKCIVSSLLLISSLSQAQSIDYVRKHLTESKVSAVSKNKDTLWLEDTQLGRKIGETWKIGFNPNPEEKSPVIIYVQNLALVSALTKSTRKKIKQ